MLIVAPSNADSWNRWRKLAQRLIRSTKPPVWRHKFAQELHNSLGRDRMRLYVSRHMRLWQTPMEPELLKVRLKIGYCCDCYFMRPEQTMMTTRQVVPALAEPRAANVRDNCSLLQLRAEDLDEVEPAAEKMFDRSSGRPSAILGSAAPPPRPAGGDWVGERLMAGRRRRPRVGRATKSKTALLME